ncbi:MAG: bifunctional glutamine synthetase adenylyltransferase/deadenyltransferase, partial [Pseudomonadota bacterium]|nr:bifunctional glutamine synthetase adenylyltransferase/deadenyltransferase [Pseudomonadota bacterium]
MAGKTKITAHTEPWSRLPGILQASAEQRWQSYFQSAEAAGVRVPVDGDFRACGCRVFAISEFVAVLCHRVPRLLADLLDSGDLLADSWPGVLSQRVSDRLAACGNEPALHQVLRQVRQREMLRIAWRDLAGWAALEETLRDLSDLADACIQGALDRLRAWQAKETPAPVGSNRRPVPLIVIAMGKLGAHELNFSSDIDLIFTYPDTAVARRRNSL